MAFSQHRHTFPSVDIGEKVNITCTSWFHLDTLVPSLTLSSPITYSQKLSTDKRQTRLLYKKLIVTEWVATVLNFRAVIEIMLNIRLLGNIFDISNIQCMRRRLHILERMGSNLFKCILVFKGITHGLSADCLCTHRLVLNWLFWLFVLIKLLILKHT